MERYPVIIEQAAASLEVKEKISSQEKGKYENEYEYKIIMRKIFMPILLLLFICVPYAYSRTATPL